MKKSIVIIGAGEGLSISVAKKFGKQGYQIGLISRNAENGNALSKILSTLGYTSYFSAADAGNKNSLETAINDLKQKLGGIDVLLYNAAVFKEQDILTASSESLSEDFKVNVGGALDAVKFLYEDLKKNKGSVLITGGGLSSYPHPMYGSLSIGKAGIRNLAIQLNERLKDDGIYVGTLTVNNYMNAESATHTPDMVAEQFWNLFINKDAAELQY